MNRVLVAIVAASIGSTTLAASCVAFALRTQAAQGSGTWAPAVIAAPAAAYGSEKRDLAIARTIESVRVPKHSVSAATPINTRQVLPAPSALATVEVPAILPDARAATAVPALLPDLPAAPAASVPGLHAPAALPVAVALHAAPPAKALPRRVAPRPDASLFDAPMEVRWAPKAIASPAASASPAPSVAVNSI
jgi:hypothetical protein